jgi:hypothetical protein
MRKMKKPTRKQLIGCGGSLATLVFLCLFTPLGIIPYGVYLGLMQRHRLDRAIENDLPEIAEACLSLRQYLTNDEFYVSIKRKDPRMPEVIRKTKCRDVGVRQDRITIEMHGGFDHFGIRLEQDQSDTNVWRVLRWWERGNTLLMTITNEQRASNQAVLPIAASAAQADR